MSHTTNRMKKRSPKSKKHIHHTLNSHRRSRRTSKNIKRHSRTSKHKQLQTKNSFRGGHRKIYRSTQELREALRQRRTAMSSDSEEDAPSQHRSVTAQTKQHLRQALRQRRMAMYSDSEKGALSRQGYVVAEVVVPETFNDVTSVNKKVKDIISLMNIAILKHNSSWIEDKQNVPLLKYDRDIVQNIFNMKQFTDKVENILTTFGTNKSTDGIYNLINDLKHTTLPPPVNHIQKLKDDELKMIMKLVPHQDWPTVRAVNKQLRDSTPSVQEHMQATINNYSTEDIEQIVVNWIDSETETAEMNNVVKFIENKQRLLDVINEYCDTLITKKVHNRIKQPEKWNDIHRRLSNKNNQQEVIALINNEHLNIHISNQMNSVSKFMFLLLCTTQYEIKNIGLTSDRKFEEHNTIPYTIVAFLTHSSPRHVFTDFTLWITYDTTNLTNFRLDYTEVAIVRLVPTSFLHIHVPRTFNSQDDGVHLINHPNFTFIQEDLTEQSHVTLTYRTSHVH